MYDETSSSTNFKVPITDINSLINWIEFVNWEKIMKIKFQWWHVQKYDQKSFTLMAFLALLYTLWGLRTPSSCCNNWIIKCKKKSLCINVLIRLRINWKVETTLPKIIKILQENLIQEWSIGILIIW